MELNNWSAYEKHDPMCSDTCVWQGIMETGTCENLVHDVYVYLMEKAYPEGCSANAMPKG